MHKKGEGRASSIFLVSILAVSVLVIYGSIVSEMTKNYGKEDLEEFSGYDAIQDEIYADGNSLVNKINESGSGELAEGQGFEDLAIGRGFKIIAEFPSMLSAGNKLIAQTNKNVGILPQEVFNLILILLTVTIVVLVIRAIVRYQGV